MSGYATYAAIPDDGRLYEVIEGTLYRTLVPNTAHQSARKWFSSRMLRAYERGGVPEYWIADPIAHTVEVLILRDDEYRSAGVFHGNALLPSDVIPGYPVRVRQFFA